MAHGDQSRDHRGRPRLRDGRRPRARGGQAHHGSHLQGQALQPADRWHARHQLLHDLHLPGGLTMRGVVFTGDRTLEMASFPDPTPGAGEVVLEMKASGMCGSDLHQYRRPKSQATGTIAGHEPCGVVVAVGPGVASAEAKVGDRMMVHHYQGCTQCSHCRSGWQQLCQEVPIKVYGGKAQGGPALSLKAPANTMVPLPEALSFPAGAAISCGWGTAYGALRRMNLSGRDTIAIF